MVECNHEHELEDLKWLNDFTPCFRIDANSITVISEPNEFYEKLKVTLTFVVFFYFVLLLSC